VNVFGCFCGMTEDRFDVKPFKENRIQSESSENLWIEQFG